MVEVRQATWDPSGTSTYLEDCGEGAAEEAGDEQVVREAGHHVGDEEERVEDPHGLADAEYQDKVRPHARLKGAV